MENKEDIVVEVCDVCGIRKENGSFRWSNPSANMVAESDAVYTRICRYARKEGCINVQGKVDIQFAYADLEAF